MSTRTRWQLLLAGVLSGVLLFLSLHFQVTATGRTGIAAVDRVGADSMAFLPIIRYERNPAHVVRLNPIASGDQVTDVTDLQHAGDTRLFIVEQAGQIRIYDGTQVLATPFLDIGDRVESGSEKGLLGLAFHPDYAANGTFYVNYTTSATGPLQTRLSRFTVDANNPDLAVEGSEQVILTINQPNPNHNGGALHFGPDGYLYVAVGDGGGSYDPNEESQNSSTILGSLLRIDVDGSTGNLPDCDQSGNNRYRIPPDNPLADGDGGACDEIWAMGLRNPWRFSFDAATDDLWITDVGQHAWEEIDFEPAGSAGGRNYGWDCYEGNHANPNDPAPACTGNRADYVFPVHEYPHAEDGCTSITGGYVYRGSGHPALQGSYLFTDFCIGELWSLTGPPQSPTVTTLTTLGADLLYTRTFGQDVNGELYVADENAVYRIEAP